MAICADYRIPHSEFLSWSKDDRDKAIGWHLRKLETCPSCGTRHEEWEKDRRAYVAEPAGCPGCEAKNMVAKSVTEEEAQRGVRVVLRRPRRRFRGKS